MITIPLYPLLGTVLVWGLLPFLLVAVAGLWWGLERSYRDAKLHEELTIDENLVSLKRTDPSGKTKEWSCQPHWTRAQMHPTEGPVPNYVTLSGKGREVEVGAFLSEDERKTLFNELTDALKAATTPT